MDLNQRYAVLTYGSQAAATGYRTANGADLNTLWAAKGTASYSSGGGGCVVRDSYLLDGRHAGNVAVGDAIGLSHPQNLAIKSGRVTASKPMLQDRVRIVTASGASLVCSLSAPIPTRAHPECLKAPHLMGQQVGVLRDGHCRWETVTGVTHVGQRAVQFISSLKDHGFWAGESPTAFVVHATIKN